MQTPYAKYQLDTTVQEVFYKAEQICKEMMNGRILPAHLLKAMLHKSLPLRGILLQNNVDIYYLEDWAEIRMESYAKQAFQDHIDKSIEILLEECKQQQHLWSEETISTHNIMYCLLFPGVVFTFEQLKTIPLTAANVLRFFSDTQAAKATKSVPSNTSDGIAIKYVTYLHENIRLENKENRLVGREEELQKMIEIISRKNKSNAIIIGEAGVGKTSMFECLAWAIALQELPPFMQNWTAYSVQISKLIAGTSYKAEIEDRLQKIIEALKDKEQTILCIDDFHLLLDSQQKNTGITSIIKEAINAGNIAIIAATNNESYRKLIERDTTLNRNFEKINLAPPSTPTALLMLEKTLPVYESFHEIELNKNLLPDLITLAQRYLHERSLPDNAIDLLDRSMAIYKIKKANTVTITNEQHSTANSITSELEADILFQSIQDKHLPSLLAKLDTLDNYSTLSNWEEKKQFLKNTLEQIEQISQQDFPSISKQDVLAVLAQITGIPLGNMQADEQERLMNMESILTQRVIGQPLAVKAVTDAIIESRAGLLKEGQPIASFFFLGPTGTGKTELAKALAQFLFNEEQTIIRFDMSEFKEEHSAALLYGAPPGYVGYEEGGLLVNKIRQQPYSIVLFDEIEKAHPSVFDTFLQILDEGKLTDKLGNIGNFSNAVILFTSNIGAEYIIQTFQSGDTPKQEDLMEKMTSYFRPEFLARITEIVPFAPITEENVLKIFDIHTQPLIKQLKQQSIELSLETEAKTWLAMQGFSPRYGVRPLKNSIRSRMRKPLSQLLISQELKANHKVIGQLLYDNNNPYIHWHIEPIQ